ncbi:MAG TPA: hypothetical protein VFX58_13535 [Chitinophagaceae bacterium]|nr:hypothetical protein [Chitinophagaceae bacterium]
MPRIYIIVCAGVLILQTKDLAAQGLPRKPTMQQVIGYRMQEQKQWANRQLPLNAVQFRMYRGFADRSWSPVMMQPRRQFVFSLQVFASADIHKPGSISMYQQPWPAARITRSGYAGQGNWWMDKDNAIGSSILRDIITNNNR